MRECIGAARRGLTHRDPAASPAQDLVKRDFTAPGPNRTWTADITYVPTGEGWLYLAVVLDVFSRRIVGWAMTDHMRTQLVIDALEMGIWNRRPAPGLIHHSDQGAQLGFKGSSQHCLVGSRLAARSAPRRESSSRGSCAAGC